MFHFCFYIHLSTIEHIKLPPTYDLSLLTQIQQQPQQAAPPPPPRTIPSIYHQTTYPQQPYIDMRESQPLQPQPLSPQHQQPLQASMYHVPNNQAPLMTSQMYPHPTPQYMAYQPIEFNNYNGTQFPSQHLTLKREPVVMARHEDGRDHSSLVKQNSSNSTGQLSVRISSLFPLMYKFY